MARKTTLGKVREAIADAASSVADAAEKHVLHPVGEKLGLIEKPPVATAKKPTSTIKSRMMTRSVTAKTKRPAKPAPKTKGPTL